MDRLKHGILYNCDVTDAQYAGLYSVCGLVMRLRDLYKWERRLPPWQEDESAKVLEWIGERETRWESLMTADYQRLSLNGHTVDAFDTKAVNQWIQPDGLYYGAGYGHSLKPTFFLAEVEDRLTVQGRVVWVLGREHARDLLTLPAFSQDRQVVLRTEAGRMYLWDQILYLSNSGRRALDFAVKACGLENQQHKTIQRHFDTIWNVNKTIYVRHEIGEIEDRVFDRQVWQGMLAEYPHTPVELFVRTLKDLLADTCPKGTLPYLIDRRNKAGLGLYMAFGNGIARSLTRPIISAFDAFMSDAADWDTLASAMQDLREAIISHTRRVMDVYQQARLEGDLAWGKHTIEKIMRNHALIK